MKPTLNRRIAAFAATVIIATCAKRAAAEALAATPRTDVVTFRSSLGLGGGNVGLGGRFGAAAEFWASDEIGVGLQGARLEQSQLIGGGDSSALTIAPVLALRSSPDSHYFFAEGGAGFAVVKHTEVHGLCFFSDRCGTSEKTEYSGYAFSAAAGWIAHFRRTCFEIGPVARFDAFIDPQVRGLHDYLLTMNVEIGVAVR